MPNRLASAPTPCTLQVVTWRFRAFVGNNLNCRLKVKKMMRKLNSQFRSIWSWFEKIHLTKIHLFIPSIDCDFHWERDEKSWQRWTEIYFVLLLVRLLDSHLQVSFSMLTQTYRKRALSFQRFSFFRFLSLSHKIAL